MGVVSAVVFGEGFDLVEVVAEFDGGAVGAGLLPGVGGEDSLVEVAVEGAEVVDGVADGVRILGKGNADMVVGGMENAEAHGESAGLAFWIVFGGAGIADGCWDGVGFEPLILDHGTIYMIRMAYMSMKDCGTHISKWVNGT